MNDYWVGVITGCLCSVILTCVIGFLCVREVKVMELQMSRIEQRQQKLEAWYEENEMVMRTYKFFNDSWQAIIDMRKEEAK